ncbi:polyhomeotic-like protein 1 [Daphnia carinata]|uniref:polyhomeotic-like protein 1 n=1 Tax=Daphnia carinata TaxID=120202 RepID=UPI0025799170|nr:polyhomeotic-like protein 1 [Daphnia carinata]
MGRTSSPSHQQFLFGLLALGVLSWSVNPVSGEVRRPPNYHHDHMPETSFTCAGKVVGGYYADPDADCQMFHVCVQVDENDVRDFKFMCPNDTVFDQENFICANWFEIDCRSSTFFYDKNLQLFQPNIDQDKNKTTGTGSSSSTGSATEEPSEQQKRQQEQQLKQLMVLEEQQAAQVLKQQQVIDQHERRQQEHQRNQLRIIQDQQKQQEKQQGRKTAATSTPAPAVAPRSISADKVTTTPSSARYVEEKGEESIIEYDYYYYDYDDSSEHGNFYANDDYDPKAPGRIIDPTNARPPLLPIIPPSTSSSVVKPSTQVDDKTKHKL